MNSKILVCGTVVEFVDVTSKPPQQMFTNYLKIGWRNLIDERSQSALSLLTLGIGLASCVLIVYYVSHELTYDHFHIKANRIYRASTVMEFPGGQDHMAITPDLLGAYLKENYPLVEDYVRFEVFASHQVKYNGEVIAEKGFSYVDRNVFDVFDYKLIAGNPEKALGDPSYLVISESTAERYFGDVKNALNKTLDVDDKQLTITGVFQDLPDNTSLPKDGLMGYLPIAFDTKAMWRFNHFTYLLVKNESNSAALPEMLSEVVKKTPMLQGMSFQIEPLRDLHFTTGITQDVVKGNKNYTLGFAAVALVLFLVIMFNYLNLAILKSMNRLKEVGVRKVIGARSLELTKQFLSEALLNLLLASAFAFGIIELLRPIFTSVTGKALLFDWSRAMPTLVISLLGMTLIMLIASVYPALMLSSNKPVSMLNKTFTRGPRGTKLRNIFMVAQFALCSCVLISFVVIGAQFNYIQNFDLGYTKENIVGISMPTDSASLSKLNFFSDELNKAGLQQKSFTAYSGDLLNIESFSSVVKINTESQASELNVIPKEVDGDFIELMHIPLANGKSFKDFSNEQWSSLVLVNEMFVKAAGWKDPIDKKIELPYGLGTLTVIGVVKNFHVASLHNPIEPVMVRAWNFKQMSYPELKNTPGVSKLFINVSPAKLATLQQVWDATFPDHELNYTYLDDAFEKQYEAEKKAITLFSYFSILAITITTIGLYTLISFQLNLRTKEIGIRKVMGATTTSLIKLLSQQSVALVFAGGVLGLIMSWNAAQWWLQNFTYKIEVTSVLLTIPVLFIIMFGAGICALKILLATRSNPVDSLRSE